MKYLHDFGYKSGLEPIVAIVHSKWAYSFLLTWAFMNDNDKMILRIGKGIWIFIVYCFRSCCSKFRSKICMYWHIGTISMSANIYIDQGGSLSNLFPMFRNEKMFMQVRSKKKISKGNTSARDSGPDKKWTIFRVWMLCTSCTNTKVGTRMFSWTWTWTWLRRRRI